MNKEWSGAEEKKPRECSQGDLAPSHPGLTYVRLVFIPGNIPHSLAVEEVASLTPMESEIGGINSRGSL